MIHDMPNTRRLDLPICTRSDAKLTTIENLRGLLADGVDPHSPCTIRRARPTWSAQAIRRVVQMARRTSR